MFLLQPKLKNDYRLNKNPILDKCLLVLHFGSNIGNRFNYLQEALNKTETAFGKPLHISGIYQTQAWGFSGQPDFLNMAAIYETTLEPEEVLKKIKNIEVETGRIHREHWHEREMDIDIIFLGNKIIEKQNLHIPHPRMHERMFVLVPLNEICPGYIHPVYQKSVSQLLKQCTDKLIVEKWDPH